ncbi:MAG: Thioredoxin 1 [Firmicutes bacterium]|nr:Thioredoxin 1 [Bacillota bacterium]MBT9157420.1 Thioredoxin 1 [Bacillota bacterium]
MGEEHRAGYDRSLARTEIPAPYLAMLAELPETIYALAISEPWCGDCRNNLPVLAKMADSSQGKLLLRCLGRDANPGLLDSYPAPDGSKRIPTFIFFAADWTLKGYFVERPVPVTQVLTSGSADEKRALRIEYNAGVYAHAVVADLLDIIKR